jgi:hypothetical protein
MDGGVIRMARFQLTPQDLCVVKLASLHEVNGLLGKIILPMQCCTKQEEQKPSPTSNPQLQERDIYQRLHAYRIITEADRDWEERLRHMRKHLLISVN